MYNFLKNALWIFSVAKDFNWKSQVLEDNWSVKGSAFLGVSKYGIDCAHQICLPASPFWWRILSHSIFNPGLSIVACRPFESWGCRLKACLPHSHLTDILSVNQTQSPWPESESVEAIWKIPFLSWRILNGSYFYYSEQMLKNVKATLSWRNFPLWALCSLLWGLETWKHFHSFLLILGQETCSQSDHIFRFIPGDGKRRTLCSSNCWCHFQVPAPVYLLTSFWVKS